MILDSTNMVNISTQAVPSTRLFHFFSSHPFFVCLQYDSHHPVKISLATTMLLVPVMQGSGQRTENLNAAGADEEAGSKPVEAAGDVAIKTIDQEPDQRPPASPDEQPGKMQTSGRWLCLVHNFIVAN